MENTICSECEPIYTGSQWFHKASCSKAIKCLECGHRTDIGLIDQHAYNCSKFG